MSTSLIACLLAGGIAIGASVGSGPSPSLADTQRSWLVAQSLALARARSAEQAPPSVPAPAAVKATAAASGARTHRRVLKARVPSGGPNMEPRSNQPAQPPASDQQSPAVTKPDKFKSSPVKGKPKTSSPLALPPITHVWLISLSQQSFSQALAQSAGDPYLARTLIPQGTLLERYSLIAKSELANGIALLSGQAPNADTEADCPTYTEVQPATVDATTGLAGGGCVYPQATQTLADQLSGAGLSWKAYVQDMAPHATGASATAQPSTTPTCRHPTVGATETPTPIAPGEDYLPYRNPFVYFDSLLNDGACTSDDVDLTDLRADLASTASTPNLSWIVPSACHDGAPTPCAPTGTSGLAAADAFLKEIVPAITASDAYQSSGLILITSDAGPATSAPAKGQPVGALLLSPFVYAGKRLESHFQNFSLLKSLERLYGVPLLGHAADPTVEQFGAGVYRVTENAAKAASRTPRSAAVQSG